MRRILPWPAQLPDTASLIEFQTKYAFLKAVPYPGHTEEQERQRYMFGYSMFVFTRSSVAVFATALIIALATFAIVHNTAPPNLLGFLTIWPPIRLLQNNILAHAAIDSFSSPLSNALFPVLSAVWVVHLAWIVWIAWRVFVERRRKDRAIDREIRLYVYLGLCLASWAYLFFAPLNDVSVFAPAFHDQPTAFVIKETIVVSAAYWLTGLSVMYLTTWLRSSGEETQVPD